MIINRTKGSASMIELLVGLAVGIFIVSSVLVLFGTVYGSDTRTKYLDHIDESKNNIRIELSNAVRWANVVDVGANYSIIADGVVISFDNQTISKISSGSTPSKLVPASIIVSNVEVQKFSSSAKTVSLIVDMDLTHRSNMEVTEHLHLVITQRALSID